jgi:zinc finger-like protein
MCTGSAIDAGQASGSGVFRPGWEAIFRMNQAALEQAVRRVSADPGLDQERKAYLMQNIMASRYIVASQKRLTASPCSPGPTFHDAAAQKLGCPHYSRKYVALSFQSPTLSDYLLCRSTCDCS